MQTKHAVSEDLCDNKRACESLLELVSHPGVTTSIVAQNFVAHLVSWRLAFQIKSLYLLRLRRLYVLGSCLACGHQRLSQVFHTFMATFLGSHLVNVAIDVIDIDWQPRFHSV